MTCTTESLHEAIKKSVPALMAVAGWLVRFEKYEVRIPNIWNEDKSPDCGDLFVTDANNVTKTFEVKGHPGVPWATLNAYPWILIDRVDIFDAKARCPDFYVITSSELTHALTIAMPYEIDMTTQQIKDKRTGKMNHCYGLPRSAFKEVRL